MNKPNTITLKEQKLNIKPLCLSEINFKLIRLKKRIIVWASITAIMVMLAVTMFFSPLSDRSSFFPAFLLFTLYIALLITDIRNYKKYKKAQKELVVHSKGADNRISAFLQEDVKVKLVQGRDISVVDKYGNYLVFFQIADGWLIETFFIDEKFPTYHSFSFDEFSKNTNWLANGKGKEPRWHEVVTSFIIKDPPQQ